MENWYIELAKVNIRDFASSIYRRMIYPCYPTRRTEPGSSRCPGFQEWCLQNQPLGAAEGIQNQCSCWGSVITLKDFNQVTFQHMIYPVIPGKSPGPLNLLSVEQPQATTIKKLYKNTYIRFILIFHRTSPLDLLYTFTWYGFLWFISFNIFIQTFDIHICEIPQFNLDSSVSRPTYSKKVSVYYQES